MYMALEASNLSIPNNQHIQLKAGERRLCCAAPLKSEFSW